MGSRSRLFFLILTGLSFLFAFQNCSMTGFDSSSGDGSIVSASTAEQPDGGSGTIPVAGDEDTTGGFVRSPGSSSPNTGSNSGSNTGSNSGSSNTGGGSTSTPTPGGNSSVPDPTCVITNVSITKSIKVLFVVDVSGSNANNTVGGPASDPSKSFRYNTIKKFLDKFRNRPNFQWQFSTFGGSTATSYFVSPTSGLPNFASNPTEMDKALASFQKSSDNNTGTPYLKAFDQITKNVNNDPDRNKANDPANYVVVFLSDGLPTDLNHVSFTGTNWESNAVKLLSLSPGRLTLTAVYYGARSETAGKNMKDMAVRLGGQFVDTNVAGYDFNVEDAVNLPSRTCQ